MMYLVPNDPELGYFGDDEVVECSVTRCGGGDCTGLRTCDPDAEIEGEGFHHVEEADCQLCGGSIPTDAVHPLCRRCEATAKAHARLERDRLEEEAGVGR